MKLNPDFDLEAALQEILTNDAMPSRLDGPQSSEERMAAREAMIRIIHAGGVRFVCTGCGSALEVKDALPCECGGFICAACRATEEEGVCDHEPPDYAKDDEDEV